MRIKGSDTDELDIATRIVRSDEDIYVIQPGRDYRLYSAFDRHDAVFFEFPSLTVDFRRPPTRDELRRQLVKAIAVRDWIEAHRVDPEPPRDAAHYHDLAHGRRVGRYAGAVEALFYKLKPGTIVVAPGKGFDDPVLFGQIVGEPEFASWRDVYEAERLPVRRVQWTARRIRGSLKPELRAKFGTPNPIMQLDRSLRDQVLRAAFDQYAFEDIYSARLNTTEDDFDTLDDYHIQTFVNYAAGVVAAFEAGVRGRELTFSEAVGYLENMPDYTPELKLNINSKGYQRLLSGTITPIVVAGLMTMATAADAEAQAPSTVPNIVNTASPHDESCQIQVEERIRGAMQLMRLDEWQRVCEAARSAKRKTGLSTSMRTGRRKR
ncbi:hypothetical protein [Sphingomonas molluscorum]|uniref:hypothetical protein n=1 Tax=Sphingomonas molluscorum TaxID=418184 RepID=UPI0031D11459